MRKTIRNLLASFAAAFLLSACQSADLIDLNNRYIDLIKQQREIAGLVNNGLGPADAATIMTGIRTRFADIGDAAMKSADAAANGAGAGPDKVKALRNEASYLSVAVRSYLSSGAIADHKVVEPSRRGIEACGGLSGLESLPTTCGYFHIARHVGAYNETLRAVRPVFNRALALEPGQKLTAEDGRSLEEATDKIIAQLEALTETGGDSGKIDWPAAGTGLRANFTTQQNKFLCNAMRLQSRIINAASDAAWNAAEAQRKTKQRYDRWIAELNRRPVKFNRRRDCGS